MERADRRPADRSRRRHRGTRPVTSHCTRVLRGVTVPPHVLFVKRRACTDRPANSQARHPLSFRQEPPIHGVTQHGPVGGQVCVRAQLGQGAAERLEANASADHATRAARKRPSEVRCASHTPCAQSSLDSRSSSPTHSSCRSPTWPSAAAARAGLPTTMATSSSSEQVNAAMASAKASVSAVATTVAANRPSSSSINPSPANSPRSAGNRSSHGSTMSGARVAGGGAQPVRGREEVAALEQRVGQLFGGAVHDSARRRPAPRMYRARAQSPSSTPTTHTGRERPTLHAGSPSSRASHRRSSGCGSAAPPRGDGDGVGVSVTVLASLMTCPSRGRVADRQRPTVIYSPAAVRPRRRPPQRHARFAGLGSPRAPRTRSLNRRGRPVRHARLHRQVIDRPAHQLAGGAMRPRPGRGWRGATGGMSRRRSSTVRLGPAAGRHSGGRRTRRTACPSLFAPRRTHGPGRPVTSLEC